MIFQVKVRNTPRILLSMMQWLIGCYLETLANIILCLSEVLNVSSIWHTPQAACNGGQQAFLFPDLWWRRWREGQHFWSQPMAAGRVNPTLVWKLQYLRYERNPVLGIMWYEAASAVQKKVKGTISRQALMGSVYSYFPLDLQATQ